jgi:MYXO-CTERM domain-containing protein
MYSSTGASKLSKAALSSAAPASLPQTGGGDGGNPTSPLAPLALLAALAIGAGRFVRRFVNR